MKGDESNHLSYPNHHYRRRKIEVKRNKAFGSIVCCPVVLISVSCQTKYARILSSYCRNLSYTIDHTKGRKSRAFHHSRYQHRVPDPTTIESGFTRQGGANSPVRARWFSRKQRRQNWTLFQQLCRTYAFSVDGAGNVETDKPCHGRCLGTVSCCVVSCHHTVRPPTERRLGDSNLSEYWHWSRPTEDVTEFRLFILFSGSCVLVKGAAARDNDHDWDWLLVSRICPYLPSKGICRMLQVFDSGWTWWIDWLCSQQWKLEGFARRVLIKCIMISTKTISVRIVLSNICLNPAEQGSETTSKSCVDSMYHLMNACKSV